MKQRKQIWTSIIGGFAMILLILDSQTALSGAKEGIQLSICTVIPSLFPFFVVSSLLNSTLLGKDMAALQPLRKLCGIPDGSESLLLLGLLGGYPVGAQAVADVYRNGHLERETAHRLLGFCSNAGPAFIFGMVSSLFTSRTASWIIWFIHIASAIAVGALLPFKSRDICKIHSTKVITITQALERSIKIMASVCGWVVLFRVILAVCVRWLLWLFPQELQILFIGLLELSNGCVELRTVSSEGTRFVLCACMLSFGGLCVGMQTVSVTRGLGTGQYFPGKILQCLISFLLAGLTQRLIFPHDQILMISPLYYAAVLGMGLLLVFILRHRKKVVAIQC